MSGTEYIGKVVAGKQDGCWLACVFDLKPDERFSAWADLEAAKNYVEMFALGEYEDVEWFDAKSIGVDMPRLFLLSGRPVTDDEPSKAAVS